MAPGYSSAKPATSSNTIPAATQPNVIPGRASLAASGARTIVLTNPTESGGDIKYNVNEFPFTISPGQSQTLNLDRDWTIKFDNGLGRQITYRLTEGKYKFTVSATKGWDVGRVEEETAPPAPPIAAPGTTSSENIVPVK